MVQPLPQVGFQTPIEERYTIGSVNIPETVSQVGLQRCPSCSQEKVLLFVNIEVQPAKVHVCDGPLTWVTKLHAENEIR